MAASATKLYSDLTLVVKTGTDVSGKDILKKAGLGRLAQTATDQNVYDVVKGIEIVLNGPVSEIQKADHNVIINA
ncbi:MAG: DUF1659 domain-containing protein [Solirubrobacterales bacterium]